MAPPGPTLSSLGAALLFTAGLPVAPVFASVALRVLLCSAGAVLVAVRGHLDSGDKVVAAGASIFVAFVAVGTRGVAYVHGP